jgi:hypothetical protein
MLLEAGDLTSAVSASAAWRHRGEGDGREGFEAVFIRPDGGGYRFDGHTVAVEDGAAWTVRYSIVVDDRWATRSARLWSWSVDGEREASVEADGSGLWRVDGRRAAALDGCLDVDLESSACTNTFPVHRLGLRRGDSADAPAAYVRVPDLGVERLEQRYSRVDDEDRGHRYDYAAPRFGFQCRLVYDESGLVVDYPGIATRMRLRPLRRTGTEGCPFGGGSA